jgi:hypothetical protein
MADILKSCVTKNSLIKMGEIIQRWVAFLFFNKGLRVF